MRHAILGAGGVGGLIGACLARSGESVTMVVRAKSLAQYPEQLRLESPFGNFSVPVARASEVPPADVLWVTVKATQLPAAIEAIRQPESIRAIVPLLNGIDHLAFLRSKYESNHDEQRVIAATIAVESERVAPGQFIHRSPFARLNVHSSGRSLLAPTLDQFQKMGFECKFIDDKPTLMWGKLVFLAPFALTTTASDKSVGEFLAAPEWRELGLSCMREACAVAVAEGAKLDAAVVVAAATKNIPGNMRSSMQKDVEQRKAPELDAIAGPIVRGARRHGIKIPATEKLVVAVEQRAGLSASLL
jgi:2-dehydropantoate 2-reductase